MELQDKLKLVAEWMAVRKQKNRTYVTHGYTINHRVYKITELRYHTSWEWQIPVWAKLNKSHDGFFRVSAQDQRIYFDAVTNDKPQEGFEILIQIIKRINDQR